MSRYSLSDSIPYLIYRISNKANQNIQDRLRPAGITLSKWRLLSSLKSRGDSTISELAACTVMKHAVVSRILTEMERAGLIQRRQSARDQRMVTISLTRKGLSLFDEAHEIAVRHQDEALRGFDRSDIAALRRLLRRIQNNLGITN
jgi:DNA-binding MarR family transcriptional regulator